jgi:hypothetical protein
MLGLLLALGGCSSPQVTEGPASHVSVQQIKEQAARMQQVADKVTFTAGGTKEKAPDTP